MLCCQLEANDLTHIFGCLLAIGRDEEGNWASLGCRVLESSVTGLLTLKALFVPFIMFANVTLTKASTMDNSRLKDQRN